MTAEHTEPPAEHLLRAACKCGWTSGRIEVKNGQNCVYCLGCGKHQYNAPKTETGEEQRSVRTRADMKPSKRARILERDANRCLTCGKPAGAVVLNVGHILSVEEGRALGATEEELDDEENLIAQCEECNLGQGSRSIPLRQAVRLIRAARMRRGSLDVLGAISDPSAPTPKRRP